MQFVNLTTRTVFTSFSGSLAPGQVSPDGGLKRRKLEDALSEVVKVCGSSLGIRLNAREAELINKLMDLDAKGGGFDPASLPEEVRNDPSGEKRNSEAIRQAQQREMDERGKANDEAARREAEINGETDPNYRKPVGPATMEGEKVDPSKLKSGFEKLMEENAKIAAGENQGEKPTSEEILDPIGAHAKKDGAQDPAPADGEADAPGAEPVSVNMAKGLDGDGTKSADATVPEAVAPGRGNAMDRKAAEVAGKLSHIGPEPKAKGEGKGKGKGKK